MSKSFRLSRQLKGASKSRKSSTYKPPLPPFPDWDHVSPFFSTTSSSSPLPETATWWNVEFAVFRWRFTLCARCTWDYLRHSRFLPPRRNPPPVPTEGFAHRCSSLPRTDWLEAGCPVWSTLLDHGGTQPSPLPGSGRDLSVGRWDACGREQLPDGWRHGRLLGLDALALEQMDKH